MRPLLLGVALAGLAAQPFFAPAQLLSGSPPGQPIETIDWGYVLLELAIGVDGSVTGIDRADGPEPFLQMVRDAAAGWRFEPARADDKPVSTHTLVIGIFRPPLLLAVEGAVPVGPRATSPQVPAPTTTVPPPYPPTAIGDGVVLVEARIDTEGRPADVRVVGPPSGFDSAVVETARAWRFRPATRDGRPVPAPVYFIVGFRMPI